jgi:hypothetical protein
MLAFKVSSQKQLTDLLFAGNQFDWFELAEASVITYNTFHIDGNIKKEYYDNKFIDDEIADYSLWEQIRPICFSLIKGKHLPIAFFVLLKYPDNMLTAWLADNLLSYSSDNIYSLFISIRYDKNGLSIMTGVNRKDFSTDRTLEQTWDKYIKTFLENNGIDVVEMIK